MSSEPLAAARSPAARSAAGRPARAQEPGSIISFLPSPRLARRGARGRRARRRRGPRRLDLRPGGRRASRSRGHNVIFTEPPTCPATPELGAAARGGGAVPGGSICRPAGGAREGAGAISSFLPSPRLARRPRKREVADIFRRHGEAWRTANAGHVSLDQRRVMRAIEICRTAELGGHVERCQDCAHTRVAYDSCRNRHCPKCQWSAVMAWLAAREAELLPVRYFHVVFTVSAAIGAMAYQNKAKVYGLLLKAAAETLTTIAADRKHLGADIGVTAVLHTWGQNLQHHPHAHCIVPGGGISPDGKRWIACKPGCFLPEVLSPVFRRLFLEGLTAAFDAGELQFFTHLGGLNEAKAFATSLAPLRTAE